MIDSFIRQTLVQETFPEIRFITSTYDRVSLSTYFDETCCREIETNDSMIILLCNVSKHSTEAQSLNQNHIENEALTKITLKTFAFKQLICSGEAKHGNRSCYANLQLSSLFAAQHHDLLLSLSFATVYLYCPNAQCYDGTRTENT